MGRKNVRICGLACLMAAISTAAMADGPGRIYTQTAASDTGAIAGSVIGTTLTHAIAVERDHTRVYLAQLEFNGTKFRFQNLPVGRFDLVWITHDHRVIEGLFLGATAELPDERAKYLAAAVAKADSFFNRHVVHRTGIDAGVAWVFTERVRDGQILRGSGEELNACLRRLEIIELREASDDWQMLRTRHLYREETPRLKKIPFLTHEYLPALCGLRVAASCRDLGPIDVSKN